MNTDKYQELALKTWYSEDSPLYLDPRHPLIKLAGEAGELLDLYGKHEYKPNFDWWKCKICGFMPAEKKRSEVDYFAYTCMNDKTHIPLVLDELGDLWYYIRIVTWQQKQSIEIIVDHDDYSFNEQDILQCLNKINLLCAYLLDKWMVNNKVDIPSFWTITRWFRRVLFLLDYSLEDLTLLNYNKLNSEPTAHGWKK